MVFTKEYWAKRRAKKEQKETEVRKKRNDELQEHLDKISVDGVEINMNMDKEKEVVEPKVTPVPQKAPATLSLKLSLAELQADSFAHSFVIEATHAVYKNLGLPPHIAYTKAEESLGMHRKRLSDINSVLEQFNETV